MRVVPGQDGVAGALELEPVPEATGRRLKQAVNVITYANPSDLTEIRQ